MIELLVLSVCVGPAIAQPMDLRVVRDEAAVDYDFSWVYWFQTHGRGYLREAIGDRSLPFDHPASRRWRGESVNALYQLLEDSDDEVRAAAVLSLARIGEQRLVDRLVGSQANNEPGLLFDASDAVRRAAWAALGVLDTTQTRVLLTAPPAEDAEELDLAAQAMAIGLLGELIQPHRRWLIGRLEDAEASLEVKRWCLWALRQHDSEELDGIFDAAIARLPSTFVIGEVLLNDQYVKRRGGAPWLVDVLRYHPDVRAWAGYGALALMPPAGAHGSTPRRLAMETRIAASLTTAKLLVPENEEDRLDLLEHLRRRLEAGNSARAMDFNRGFDMIAYAMHCNATEQDLELLYEQMRGRTMLPPDDPEVIDALEEGEAPELDDLVAFQRDNASRDYAALSAGLLIRRATKGTQLALTHPLVGREPIDIERLKRRFGIRLMRAVANPREPVSYRAACALAIGLTADTRYLAELTAELGKLRGGDEAVLGYGLLSLAMLGEPRAAEPAKRYLTRPGPIKDPGDRIGRHAALRALAVIGEQGGADTALALRGAWGRNVWVSLGVAEATAWAGRYDALPGMLEASQSESASWRRASAMALGRVFDRSFPSRLSPLIEGINPVLSYRDENAAAPDTEPTGPDESPEEGDAASEPPQDWPRIQMHALGDPFFFYLLRSKAAPPIEKTPLPFPDPEPAPGPAP